VNSTVHVFRIKNTIIESWIFFAKTSYLQIPSIFEAIFISDVIEIWIYSILCWSRDQLIVFIVLLSNRAYSQIRNKCFRSDCEHMNSNFIVFAMPNHLQLRLDNLTTYFYIFKMKFKLVCLHVDLCWLAAYNSTQQSRLFHTTILDISAYSICFDWWAVLLLCLLPEIVLSIQVHVASRLHFYLIHIIRTRSSKYYKASKLLLLLSN